MMNGNVELPAKDRSLLVLFSVSAVLVGTMITERVVWSPVENSVSYIERRGGWVDGDSSYERRGQIAFYRHYLDVHWSEADVTNDELVHVLRLAPSCLVDLSGNPAISDAGMMRLCGLRADISRLKLTGTSASETAILEFKKTHSRCEVEY